MKRRFLTILLLAAFLLSACAVQEAPTALEPFAEYIGLPSDGLTHEPYGLDALYGDKEAPAVWWQREPSDVTQEEQTAIVVSVGKHLEDRDIWIAWTLNGQIMNAIPCAKRAKLLVNGVERGKYQGELPALTAGDQVTYMLCAGLDGVAEKSLGPFAFRVAGWYDVALTGGTVEERSARYDGAVNGLPLSLCVRLDENGTAALEISAAEKTATGALEPLEWEDTRLTVEENGGMVVSRDGREIFRSEGMELLTDGEEVRAVRLTISAEAQDAFYGFGMKYDALNQRGKTVDTYCVNWYKNQNGETYTPVPYYFVPNRYGLFVDSTYYSRFDMCDSAANACVIEVQTGGKADCSFYLFTGTNAEIAASYANAAGKAALPPAWAFGPWISANEWNKQSEIMAQLDATVKNEIPTSVIVIEAWSDEETFYTFNDAVYDTTDGGEALAYEDFTFTGRWPDPKGMVEALHANDIKCLLWQIPVLKYSTDATPQSLRDQVYAQEKGYVLSREDGSIYRLPAGTWFGGSLLMDFTNAEATDWFLEKRRYLIEDVGIDGFKTDGGEFVWGRDVQAADGRMGDELRNAYPDLYAQAYYDFGNRLKEGTVTFSRAGGSTMQTHPLCWVGDQDSSFPAFQAAIRATLSASMSGIPFVAWDIAGFSGDIPTTELYQRSVAQAAFSPVMQIHSENPGDPQPSQARTPWNMAERKGDEACLETYRYYANLRMNLLPYIYTEAKWSAESGEPMARSMAYAFPEEEAAWEYELQYLFGRHILVAPVTKPNAKSVEVYLPEGTWYHLFTGQRYEGGIHTVAAETDEIPVFVREGTILPIQTNQEGVVPSYVGNGTQTYETLGYWVFPGQGSYTWYDHTSGQSHTVKTDGTDISEDGAPFAGNILWASETQ